MRRAHHMRRRVAAHEARDTFYASCACPKLVALVGVNAYNRLDAVAKCVPYAPMPRSKGAVHVGTSACVFFSEMLAPTMCTDYYTEAFLSFSTSFLLIIPFALASPHRDMTGHTMYHVRVRALNDQRASAYTTRLCRRINRDAMHVIIARVSTLSLWRGRVFKFDAVSTPRE